MLGFNFSPSPVKTESKLSLFIRLAKELIARTEAKPPPPRWMLVWPFATTVPGPLPHIRYEGISLYMVTDVDVATSNPARRKSVRSRQTGRFFE
jgi:hypothetical protein